MQSRPKFVPVTRHRGGAAPQVNQRPDLSSSDQATGTPSDAWRGNRPKLAILVADQQPPRGSRPASGERAIRPTTVTWFRTFELRGSAESSLGVGARGLGGSPGQGQSSADLARHTAPVASQTGTLLADSIPNGSSSYPAGRWLGYKPNYARRREESNQDPAGITAMTGIQVPILSAFSPVPILQDLIYQHARQVPLPAPNLGVARYTGPEIQCKITVSRVPSARGSGGSRPRQNRPVARPGCGIGSLSLVTSPLIFGSETRIMGSPEAVRRAPISKCQARGPHSIEGTPGCLRWAAAYRTVGSNEKHVNHRGMAGDETTAVICRFPWSTDYSTTRGNHGRSNYRAGIQCIGLAR